MSETEDTTTPSIVPPPFHSVRLVGEFGPVLRWSGELSVATEEALRRELALLMPMSQPVLTLDLAECRFLDVDGVMTILNAYRRLHHEGRRLVLVAGTGLTSRLFQVTGIDRIIPTFPTGEVASRALRGGRPPEPPPESWEAARAATLARWRAIREMLAQAPPEGILRQMTTMTALCKRSEELFEHRPVPAGTRCQFCPFFHALGGQPGDEGCRTVLDPLIEAIRAGDREAAREMVAALIRTLEETP